MSAASWFDEDAVPGGEHPLPPLALVSEEFPRRIPGATLNGHVPPAAWVPPSLELLRQAAEGLQHLDDEAAPVAPAARGFEPLYAASVREHYGTAPVPAFTPAEGMRAAPDGTWLLDFLSGLLDDAAEGAGRRIGEPCPDCAGTMSGWCPGCSDALARAARYERLAALVEAAPGDREAVRALLSDGWRSGRASGVILEQALAGGGAR